MGLWARKSLWARRIRRFFVLKKTFVVADMACQHCVGRIKKALDAAGVTDYEVVLEGKEVRVEESQAAAAVAALSDAGYPAVPKD